MFRELMTRRIGAYVGVLSIIYSGVVAAMEPRHGNLTIYGRNGVEITGHPAPIPVVADVSKVTYEDFDATPYLSQILFGGRVSSSTEAKIRAAHLDTNVPHIGVTFPFVDYNALNAIPTFITERLGDKVHPSKCSGAKDFFEKVIIRNQQRLREDATEIPDMDCLYYKDVGGVQHLFLRLSSQTRQEAERFKQQANGESIFLEDGDLAIISDGNIKLDHQNVGANNIYCEAKNKLLNRASKMHAKWVIQLVADEQRHETVINKWVKYEGNSDEGTYTEGVSSIDDCGFIAQKVIQDGRKVDNIGIFVEADTFEDRAYQTTNMPAKITLYNRAWKENNGLLSSSRTEVKRTDDILVPNRCHVNYYRSVNPETGSSVKFGYTLIKAGSKIEVIKDTKEDVVVDEKHTIEIHEEKSGFSMFGGVSVPDPTAMLQKLHHAYSSGNMIGLTTSTISAIAKGFQVCRDCKQIGSLLKEPWTLKSTKSLLLALSHFVHGPSIQFGHRSVDIKQSTTTSHGNTFIAPEQVYHNKEKATFAGDYFGKNISIKTKTFVTLDLPQTMDYEMSVHQSGVSMDLLTFALTLTCAEKATALGSAMAASAISISCQNNKMHQEIHKPTRIHASERLDIEAENGELTQAQIKAGIVHAVFADSVVLKTLANEKWSKQSGGGVSFGFGDLADMLKSATISNIDAGSFEKIIDDFASMVGEKEFYLKVGNVLRTESAFVGHMNHDPKHEHIDARIRQDVEVEQVRRSWDNSFDLSVGALIEVKNAIASMIEKQVTQDVNEGKVKKSEAKNIIKQKTEEKNKEIDSEEKKIEKVADKIAKIDEELKEETKGEKSNKEKAKALVSGIEKINKEQASLVQEKPKDKIQEIALKTKAELLAEARGKYLADLKRLEVEAVKEGEAEAISSAQTLVWHELDSSYAMEVDPTTIKLSNEAKIRQGAREKVGREFQRYRDIAEADYRAYIRFYNGEGYSDKVLNHSAAFVVDDDRPLDHLKLAPEVVNSPEARLDRLQQEERTKIGENTFQRAGRFVPYLGTYLDYHYGRISGREFCALLGIELMGRVNPIGAVEGSLVGGVGTCVRNSVKAAGALNFATTLKGSLETISNGNPFNPWDY